jgi:diguanylate cyclase (GGDEF)-like protein
LLLYQVLFGAAALHPSMSALSQQPPAADTRLSWQRLSFLLAAMLIAPGILVIQTALGLPVDVPLVVGGSVVLFGLVSVRMAGMVSERRTLEERLAFQASHDHLTGLPNRRLFSERLENATARLSRQKQGIAVLFIDLDGFKRVNDSLGHDAGDELLVGVGRRLRDCTRPTDTVARLGGDEFTVLLEGVTQVSDATRAAERVTEALRPPLAAGGHEMLVTASIGIALGMPGQGASDLLSACDAAMYEAKKNGKSRYEVRGANV